MHDLAQVIGALSGLVAAVTGLVVALGLGKRRGGKPPPRRPRAGSG
jgi:hypothetical protein